MRQIFKPIILLLVFMISVTANAQFSVDGLYYNFNDDVYNTVTLVGPTSSNYSFDELIIPESVRPPGTGDDYIVTAIGNYAFKGSSELRSVTIPSTITSIGKGAFTNCSKLREVTCLPIIPPSMNESFDSHDACLPFFVVDPDYNDEDNPLVLYVPSVAYESYKNQDEQYHFFSCILGYDWEKTAPPSVFLDDDYSFDRLVGCSVELSPNEDCDIYYAASCYSSAPWYDNSWALWPQEEFYVSAMFICIPTHFFLKACAIAEGKLPSDLVYATDGEGIWPSYEASFDFSDAGIYYSYINDDEVYVTFEGYYDPCNAWGEKKGYDIYMDYLEYYSGDLIIPSSVRDYNVTCIGQNACTDCVNLNSVTLPASIHSIGDAFENCPNLTKITCLGTEPPTVDYDDGMGFSEQNYQNVTLYVPQSAIDAYRNAPVWCNFQNIVGVNDDNYLSLEDVEAFRGDTIVIPVALTNEASIISFQTDIFLPEGIELLQEDGDYLIDPSDRMTHTHSIVSSDVSNGAVRVLCYSSNYKPFTGESGDDLFYLTVKVADDAEGDYAIQLKNTLLTTSDFEELVAPDCSGNVHVKSYLTGDANNSGTVTVTDVVVTSQYILEQNPHPFIFEAADVNADGTITVTDVSRIAWMVLNPTLGAPMRATALWNNGDRMSGESVTILPGETRKVSIALDNEMDYTAFQLDLNLPEGLSANNFAVTDRAGSHAFDVSLLADGNTRALCYSPVLKGISGHEGALLTFDVTAMGLVQGDITVDGIELVTIDCETVKLDGFTVGVNNSSAINEVTNGKTVARVDYFNLAGQQLTEPVDGVTLIVTTYTDGTRIATKVYR